MFDFTQGSGSTVLAVGALIVAFVAVIALITKRIRRVPPNEALIIVGRGAGRNASADADHRLVV
ncbi:hypothetical protein, partial [Streptomyces sp. SID12488]|uniref:hypothetical protein n=1 Tax=Streptomyces sp. SID12488 TaxID=2706040 RepID=UPI0013F94459